MTVITVPISCVTRLLAVSGVEGRYNGPSLCFITNGNDGDFRVVDVFSDCELKSPSLR